MPEPKDKKPKKPNSWYLELKKNDKELVKHGDELFESLRTIFTIEYSEIWQDTTEGHEPEPGSENISKKKKLTNTGKEKLFSQYFPEMKKYDIMHKACIYFYKYIWRLCDEKTKKTLGRRRATGNILRRANEEGFLVNVGRKERTKEVFERTLARLKLKNYMQPTFLRDS